MKSGIIFIMLCFAITFSNNGLAKTGTETGNGGDYITQDFMTSAQDALKFLQQHSQDFPFIDINKLQSAMNSAKLESLPEGIHFSDAIRTAKNFPKTNTIIINSDRWLKINEPIHKMALSLHEFLGLTGYEVNNYIITSQLFGISNQQLEAPPSSIELDQSFDFIRKKYLSLLAFAGTITAPDVKGVSTKLTEEKCKSFVSDEINKYKKINLSEVKFDCDADATIILQNGKNILGVPFSKILQTKRTQTSGNATFQKYFFINDFGKIIAKIENSNYLNEYESRISSIDINGNGYQRSSSRIGSFNGPISNEILTVIQADGSFGDKIEKHTKFPINNSSFKESITFSVTSLNDWQEFALELYDLSKSSSCRQDSCPWSGTSSKFGDGMISSYKYLGNRYATPTNFREITYVIDGFGNITRQGRYVSSNRVYQVTESK